MAGSRYAPWLRSPARPRAHGPRPWHRSGLHACLLGAVLAGVPAFQAAAQERSAPSRTPEQRYFEWTDLPFAPDEYARRRAALLGRLRDSGGGVFLAPGAHGLSHGDTFRQLDDFLYLTGLELPGSALALDADREAVILFAPARDFRFENPARTNDFPGRPLADDPEIGERTGIADVRPAQELPAFLSELARDGRLLRMNPERPGAIEPLETSLVSGWGPGELALFHVQRTHPSIAIRSAFRDVALTRLVKSEAEIALMRQAAELTSRAIARAAETIREGIDERTLAGTFEAACKEEGSQRVAFASIVKSGPNALWPWRILAAHYDRRNRALEAGDVVIFDVGCELDHYVSDVGRTFPVSGRFTEAQRRILAMEVAVSHAIIAAVRPGVTFAGLQEAAAAAIPEEHRRFMQTGLFFGHHLGLSTGDPSLADEPLRAGMVFTVEPWYYNHDLGISVFTEDEVLVTADGADVLTKALPREPAALERMVRAGRLP